MAVGSANAATLRARLRAQSIRVSTGRAGDAGRQDPPSGKRPFAEPPSDARQTVTGPVHPDGETSVPAHRFVERRHPQSVSSQYWFAAHKTATPMKTFAKTDPDRPMQLEEAVWVDPARMSGVPCFRGTRLPVQQLFDWIEDGVPLDEFLQDFQVDRRAATAVLRAGASAVCAAATRNPDCAARSWPHA